MEMFLIRGGRTLSGTVRVGGSKNAALPILAASLAIPGAVTVHGVPQLRDVATMIELLNSMGAITEQLNGSVQVYASDEITTLAPYELVRQMRASVCVLGPLVARFGLAKVSLPGGCNIGHRPIDLHLKGLAALGADIQLNSGYVIARCRRLKGAEIDLMGPAGPTVTGTCNVMSAATLAEGCTIIRNAAMEPEVADLARFLNAAGAVIQGAGTDTLEIHGVDALHSVAHTVIPDRIEAGTLALAAAITGGDITIQNAPVASLASFLELLQQIGLLVEATQETLRVRCVGDLRPTEFSARPYPGIPTDLQAQLMALLSLVPGESRITDTVFPERFMHAAELVRLGADVRVQGSNAVVHGAERLSGAPVMASDLRASAALVLAGLAAEGQTELRRIYHLDRGYQGFERKLNSLGAVIERLQDPLSPTMAGPHFGSSPKNAESLEMDRIFDQR